MHEKAAAPQPLVGLLHEEPVEVDHTSVGELHGAATDALAAQSLRDPAGGDVARLDIEENPRDRRLRQRPLGEQPRCRDAQSAPTVPRVSQ